MKQQTVLQEIIEKLYADSKYLNGENDHEYDKIVGKYIKTIADDLKENYLKKEEEQIKSAYEIGEEDGYWHPENGYNKKFKNADEYFNQTYKP